MTPDYDEKHVVPMMAVFTFYGLTMLQVQVFEMQVGRLWMVVLARRGDQPEDWEAELDRAIRRSIHAAQKATPSGLRRDMEGELSEKILVRLEWGIKWRNILAHRFLRERLRTDVPSGRFADETIPLLMRLNRDFQRATKEIGEEANRLRAKLPRPEDVPEGVEDIFRGHVP